ncbi:MAG: hypothetical protein EOP84_14150 [Verrucomicrobiaceae bacterium]|nr:MAG: hypothetical protein EOP84_14150 [Verrucomicrobiaceae bacterium]
MRKSTFHGMTVILGVVMFLFCIWFVIFRSRSSYPVPPEGRVEQHFLAIGNALRTYQINAGRPPTTDQGLDVLVNEPTQGPKPRRWVQMMKKLYSDPWQTPYRYTLLESKGNGWRWELRSAGRDRIFGNDDDLVDEY